jgi:hypothetical protein
MSIRRTTAAFTLVEVLVGIAVGGMIIATAGTLWFYSNRSFAAQLNYVDMDQASQMALDRLSRDIRQTKDLLAATNTKLLFADYDDEQLLFEYVERDKALYRIKGGITNALLRNCKALEFTIYQRNPIFGTYDQYPVATAENCKLVHVRWICSRPLYGTGQENTESVSSAKIVIRNP